jgi:hypothetical protein
MSSFTADGIRKSVAEIKQIIGNTSLDKLWVM